MSGIIISGLKHSYPGGTVAVNNLELGVGERLVLYGPNGSGKTTMLRLLAGTLAGGPKVDTAYLPQRPIAFRGSAAWNLTLGLEETAHPKARRLAGELGVSHLLERSARRLSGGERQRLALARVLARPEPIVLLDEPVAALDVSDRASVAALVNKALGERSAIIVTHDREIAAALGDRIAVMVDGRIRQVGTPQEVFTQPADEIVAGALGIANVLGGEVMEIDGPLIGLKVGPVVVWGLGEGSEGASARAIFGAEAVTVYAGTSPNAGSARNTWEGTVEEVRPAGRLIEVLIDCGPRVAALVTPGSMEALGLAAGSKATVAVKATAVRVLSA